MGVSTLQSDVYVNGNFSAKTMQLASASVGDAQVQSAANINAYKLSHLHRQVYSQPSGAAVVGESRVVFEALNTGTITDFRAGAVTIPVGADTCSVDLKKNGTSVLSAPLSITSSFVSRVSQAATIATPGVVAGDILEVVVTPNHTSGTLPQEVWATLNVNSQSTG